MARNSNYKNMSTDELHICFDRIIREGGQGTFALCEILVEFEARGEFHPMQGKGIFKHARAIASGKLSPLAVPVIVGDDNLVSIFETLPISEQEDIASGKVSVPVARFDKKAGSVVIDHKSVVELSPGQVNVAFTDGGIRPPEKQKQMVLNKVKEQQKAKVSAIPHKSDLVEIIVNKKDNMVTVGKTTVDITVLLKALVAGGVNVMMSKAA